MDFTCTNDECPCKATTCAKCGKPIVAGEIICDDNCAFEVDCDIPAGADFSPVLYPHG